jgi:hypothetical protein
MSYIVKYLSNIEDLKKELETTPENIRYYAKYEGFDGSSEAIDYIDEKIAEYILNKSK